MFGGNIAARAACVAVIISTLLFTNVLHAQMKVRVEPVVRAAILEQLPVSGSVISPRASDLAVQQSGLVLEIHAEAGDMVEAGQVLLDLDAELAELELQRLKAMLEESQLLSEEAVRLADEARRLIDSRSISQTEHSARLANEAAGQSRVRQLQLQIRAQEVRIERHHLVAPFSGTISQRLAEEGEWLDANSAAFRLVQIDPLRVIARVPERFYGEVKAGTAVEISVDALPGKTRQARVDAAIAEADVNSRSFGVRIDIPNADMALAPGMSAHLDFILGDNAESQVLQVVADAIVRRSDGSAVVWVVRNGVVDPVEVTIGRRNERNVEVISDQLNENDQVVTLGNESLRPGQDVTVDSGP